VTFFKSRIEAQAGGLQAMSLPAIPGLVELLEAQFQVTPSPARRTVRVQQGGGSGT
jgi:hypothetical protein